MNLGAVLLGTGRGVADFGEQVAEADETVAAAKARQAAAKAAADEREAAIAEKRRQYEAGQALKLQKKPIGSPYVGTTGKMVQKMYEPGTGKITEEEIGGTLPETDAEKWVRGQIAIGGDPAKAKVDALVKFGPTPPKVAKPDPLQAKLDFYTKLFGEKKAKEMIKREGGGLPRLRAPGEAAGGAGFTQEDVEEAVRQDHDGTTPLDKLRLVPGMKPLAEAAARFKLTNHIESGKAPTTQEKNAGDSAKQIQNLLPTILPKLASHKDDSTAQQLIDKAKMVSEYTAYKHGLYTGPDSDLLQLVSFAQILGAQPWLKTGRNKVVYEDIKTHLPSPTDSKQQMYKKIIGLQQLLPMIETPTGAAASDIKVGDTVTVN